jgi:hypothetical protein
MGSLKGMQLSIGGHLALTRLGTAGQNVMERWSIVIGQKALHLLGSGYTAPDMLDV